MDDIIEDTEAMRIILAGMAMTGVIAAHAHPSSTGLPTPEEVTSASIAYANNLIGALKKKKIKHSEPKPNEPKSTES